ncbi:MAG: metal ABC transporter ATP-binding protein [Rubellimicrobium sp.]|nr:metal ABC transporter ATP-binding protein [Rubellimicrobium sp.]
MTLIAVNHADLWRGRVRVLHDVSLAVAPGEIVTIVGPNGSGKSSLLRLMTGEFVPRRGRVTRAAGLRIGYVPQKLHVDPTMPLTARRLLDLPQRVDEAAARRALEGAGADALAGRQVADLSGGQAQRVLLARAMLSDPQILLLDEPTQGLDQPGAAAFYQRIEGFRRRTGAAVVMVSHDLHVVMSASDRVICLNGHICCEGTPAHVAAAPEWRALFGTGTGGALALYRHAHDHGEHPDHGHHHHDQDHDNNHGHRHGRDAQ